MSEFEGFDQKGPKRVPGPNDEAIERESGIKYLNEDGTPEEEEKSEAELLANRVKAYDAALAEAEEVPPEPAFVIVPNAYGPGTFSAKFADGTPVGVWLHDEHPTLDGGAVSELLVLMGMPGELAAWYGIQRDKARMAGEALHAHPGQAAFAAHEAEREKTLGPIREAFVKAQGKKT